MWLSVSPHLEEKIEGDPILLFMAIPENQTLDMDSQDPAHYIDRRVKHLQKEVLQLHTLRECGFF